MTNPMFLSEYWSSGHPDDMKEDWGNGEGMTVEHVSEDPQKLIAEGMRELKGRFGEVDFEYQVVSYDDRFPDTHFAVQAREVGDGDDEWIAYYLIHPVEVL